MNDGQLEGVEELIECGRFAANGYLAAGYRCVFIASRSSFIEKEGHPGYVRKDITYVMARPEGIERIEMPKREPRPEKAVQA